MRIQTILFTSICALSSLVLTACGGGTPMDSGVMGGDVVVPDVPNLDAPSCAAPAMNIDSNRDGKVSCLELQDFIALERPTAMDPRLACLTCESPLDTCSTPACDRPAAAVIEFSVTCNPGRQWVLNRLTVCPLPDVPNPPPRDVMNTEGGAGDGGDAGAAADVVSMDSGG